MKALDRRTAGLLVPLFSLRSEEGWGVGDYPDLGALASWAHTGGFSLVMTLPLLEPSPGQDSPYSSCSFFALDPLYIRVSELPEFEAEGGETSLTSDERGALEHVRSAPSVRHESARWLKNSVLQRLFRRFEQTVLPGSARFEDHARFAAEHAHWLPDYALFRTLKAHHPESWRSWPEALRARHPETLDAARRTHAAEIAYRSWLQWIAFRQLEQARAACHRAGVRLGGDEPFLVADDSADVWAHQERYRFDATVGAPPDAFSADGQEWGLPPYRWETIADEGYELFAQRGRHTAKLYDLIRIDHVVGLYRTYHRPIDGSAHFFWPEGAAAQKAQGEAVLGAFASAGTGLIAEDLGVIPDFVRTSLQSLGIPGYRVLRWEKQHDGQFRDPMHWPALSVATTGTHDTETSREWWDALPAWERQAALRLPSLGALPEDRTARFTDEVLGALLDTVYRAPSLLALLPVQDVLGLRERVNTPNTVGPDNWSWRLPWTLRAMAQDAIVQGRMAAALRLAEQTGRVTSR